MKRLIVLDQEEYNAIVDLTNATNTYMPAYQTVSLTTGFYYLFDTADTEMIEKILLLGARAGLSSP